ncbi:cytochrome P450 20A1-like [Octopus vulgaris]|uniref:Cytochrome P450 20A1-like n=1 Tax=Octopus vulgaris TaxID=6645 RepID=A0AA36AIE8_OCTVU|nr:cytochrome P450 20A1-like [Octopus vulgaris]
MLDFVIFAVFFVVTLIISIIYLYPGSRRPTTILGLEPSSKQDGNLADIIRSGSLHEFLINIHKQYGSITSFWMSNYQIISLASPELFKNQKKIVDRSSEVYLLFEPLLGSESLFNGDESGKQRRIKFTKSLNENSIKTHSTIIAKITDELLTKWSVMSDQHIPVEEHMMALAIKYQVLSTIGDTFKDNMGIFTLRRNFDTCWYEIQRCLQDLAEPESHRIQAFKEAQNFLEKYLQDAVTKRRDQPTVSPENSLLIDFLLKTDAADSEIVMDLFMTMMFDFHTLGCLLTWLLYFLATHSDVQTKLTKEVQTLKDDEITPENLKKMKYLKQVLDETHRCAVLIQWSAYTQSFDGELEGHKIPKNTPILHAIGVLMQEEQYWPLPTQFDPERFAEDKAKSGLVFQPFDIYGKNGDPKRALNYVCASICITKILRMFRLGLVKGQVVTPVYGLVTKPDDEIWITAQKHTKQS